MLQDGLDFMQCLLLANVLAHYLGRKVHDNLPILYHLFHKPRFHHHSIVGNGIIEGKCRDRWYLSDIADAHPWEVGPGPVYVLPVLVLFGDAHDGRSCTHKRHVQVVGDARTVDALHKAFRIVAVVVVNDAAYTNVGTVH